MEAPSSSLFETLDPNPQKTDLENPPPPSTDPSSIHRPASTPPTTPSTAAENPNPQTPDPNPNPNPLIVAPPPPSAPTFAPSFRPLGAPQYPVQNPTFPMSQNPNIHPPGVSIYQQGSAGGVYSHPPVSYGQPPNGYYQNLPGPPMAIHPPGMASYPAPYPNMFRPGFPPRPMPPYGVMPQLSRPPIPGVRGPPIVTPIVRPAVPIVVAQEKPQTTVYVGRIAPTVDNEFLLALLRLCGPVKSLKRVEDPSDGTLKSFGFCEFESAEGILRAMRLLSKLNIDRQEMMLNINTATREYLVRYVEKKTERERERLKETEAQVVEKENGSALVEMHYQPPKATIEAPPKPTIEETKDNADDSGDQENDEKTKFFGIVTDEDRDADRDALEKIKKMIEERIKTKPLPLPHVQDPFDSTTKSNSEVPCKSRDGDSDVDILKNDAAEDKNEEETMSENKPVTEHERPETSSPDKRRRHDRRSVDRGGRVRDMKREKERELERYERDRERARVRREREREVMLRESERMYRERVKDWEARERDREHLRQREREREKEYQREREWEVSKEENESDDDDRKKRRHRSSAYEEKRRKRLREKEDDSNDRTKEEEEVVEAKKIKVEVQPSKDLKPLSNEVTNVSDNAIVQEVKLYDEDKEDGLNHADEGVSGSYNVTGAGNCNNDSICEPIVELAAVSEMKQNNNAPIRKLGFGLIGSGKRATVPSVFHEEDDEDVDDKKMRPLVPIDYSTEEIQAVETNASGPHTNLVAAAEFAKRISGVSVKEEKHELERERNGRSNDRSSQRDRDRYAEENARARNESKERMHGKIYDRDRNREDKPKTENKKLLDAKQLIDMIPKTKDELFAYEINWSIYDKYNLHERMRPWISKKINEFLGEEEPTLVEYIVSSTKDHVHASKMLELLQTILDDEAEMFVLKMWRMLIFEIKKVETGLSGKARG